MIRRFWFNFIAALSMRLPYGWEPEWLTRYIVDGCEKHTPQGHRWRDEVMF